MRIWSNVPNRFLYLFLLSIVISILPTGPIRAQTPRKDSLRIEQALSRYGVNTLLFSPDGTRAVVVVSQPAEGEKPGTSHIWMVDVGARTIRQFTRSAKSENFPRWSPDGKQLSFLSGREGEIQLYLMDVNGGEALPLTQSKTSISDYEWNPLGHTIAYITEEALTDSAKKRVADKYDEKVLSEEQRPSRLFVIDVATKMVTPLMKMNRNIQEMKWMPSGDALLLLTEELPAMERPVRTLVQFSVKDSVITRLPSPKHNAWGNVQIAPDGKSYVFQSARLDGPVPHDLFRQVIGSEGPQNLTAAGLDLPIRNGKFISPQTLLYSVQKGFMSRLYTISDKGDVTSYGLDRNVMNFDVASNGSIIFESADASHLSEIWLTGPDKQPVQLSHFNKAFDSLGLISPIYITYKSFDGTSVEGALFKPAGGGKLLPLVVHIHGGPTAAFQDTYSPWDQLFVQKGYAVFCPNVRGSTGYGWKFMTSNKNDWGGGDFKDVLAGMDMLIAKEGIDPARIGISGWSYGGYMAMWAVTQTDRFKASVAGAGLSDLASEFGTEGGPEYDQWFFGTPYEHLDNFTRHSPITFMKNAKTPTLIIQGENDETDPIGQSQQFYRGLRYYQVPTELVVYPREPHGFREIKHNIDFYTRMLAWFDKYVLKYGTH